MKSLKLVEYSVNDLRKRNSTCFFLAPFSELACRKENKLRFALGCRRGHAETAQVKINRAKLD